MRRIRTLHYLVDGSEGRTYDAACGRDHRNNITPDVRYVECKDCLRFIGGDAATDQKAAG